jgi:alanine dehydrogenase
MDRLSLGVLATSTKENERRLPIRPRHFDRIDADLRARIVLEHGYGDRYGVSDHHLAPMVAGMHTREEIVATTDIVLLPKPTLKDMASLRDGQVLWGWPHAVQDPELTQISIDKRLTLIAWEAMNHGTPSGAFIVHVFHMNNERVRCVDGGGRWDATSGGAGWVDASRSGSWGGRRAVCVRRVPVPAAGDHAGRPLVLA